MGKRCAGRSKLESFRPPPGIVNDGDEPNPAPPSFVGSGAANEVSCSCSCPLGQLFAPKHSKQRFPPGLTVTRFAGVTDEEFALMASETEAVLLFA